MKALPVDGNGDGHRGDDGTLAAGHRDDEARHRDRRSYFSAQAQRVHVPFAVFDALRDRRRAEEHSVDGFPSRARFDAHDRTLDHGKAIAAARGAVDQRAQRAFLAAPHPDVAGRHVRGAAAQDREQRQAGKRAPAEDRIEDRVDGAVAAADRDGVDAAFRHLAQGIRDGRGIQNFPAGNPGMVAEQSPHRSGGLEIRTASRIPQDADAQCAQPRRGIGCRGDRRRHDTDPVTPCARRVRRG